MVRSFALNNKGISEGTELVRNYLEKKGIRGKEQSEAVLIAEESLTDLVSIASSNAAIPINMDACRDRLGVSPIIYKLSIPLGATLNIDGTCILLGVQTLALAKICGVSVSAGMLVSLGVTIIILSLGAPGVPGAGVILTSCLLTQLNVPVESVSLVIGIGPIMGMFICMNNCLGDAVVTTVVAKNEGQLDMDILNSKKVLDKK